MSVDKASVPLIIVPFEDPEFCGSNSGAGQTVSSSKLCVWLLESVLWVVKQCFLVFQTKYTSYTASNQTWIVAIFNILTVIPFRNEYTLKVVKKAKVAKIYLFSNMVKFIGKSFWLAIFMILEFKIACLLFCLLRTMKGRYSKIFRLTFWHSKASGQSISISISVEQPMPTVRR